MDFNNRQQQGPSRRNIHSGNTGQNSAFNDSNFYSMDDFGSSNLNPSPGPQTTGTSSASAAASASSAGTFHSAVPDYNNPYGGYSNPPQNQFQSSNIPPSTSNQQYQQPMMPNTGFYQPGPFGDPMMSSSSATTGQQPQPPSAGPGLYGPSQHQFLMATGQQLLSNPIAAAAIDAYSQSLVNKSLGWVERTKYFFAVDTNYVVKKLMLIFIPFLHKDWAIRFESDQVVPKIEPNMPDLYIPSMAFVTYILLSGYILGLQNRFAPEQLGIYASTALAWLLLEVILILVGKYLLGLEWLLGFTHLIAFGGYKFVCIVAILIGTFTFGKTAYFFLMLYCSISLGYFLLKTLITNVQSATYGPSGQHRSIQYMVLVICLIQPIVMYFLTTNLVNN